MLFKGGSPSITNILQASPGKSIPSYLLTKIIFPTCLPLFNAATILSMLSFVAVRIPRSSQNFALEKEGTSITTLYFSAIFSIFSFISISDISLFTYFGKIMSLSPISLAFSGVIMFFISSVFNPNAETNTLSSANVALIYMRLLASSRLDILSKSIPLGDISIAEAVIIQSLVSKLRSINGNPKYIAEFLLLSYFVNIL